MKNTRETKEKNITAEKMKEILEKDYDIHSVPELAKAIKESPGVNIGIFTTPLDKKV